MSGKNKNKIKKEKAGLDQESKMHEP